MKVKELTCFKAYDIRGELGDELNMSVAYRIGCAYANFIMPKTVVLCGDMRLSTNELKKAIADGLTDCGVNVIDIGMGGTEELYFAVQYLNSDGGIMVTASHNPINFNGMKMVREQAKPISGDTGLLDIKRLAEIGENVKLLKKGKIERKSFLPDFAKYLLSFVDVKKFKPLKIVVNAGNGAAGQVIDQLEKILRSSEVPIEFVKINHQADGSFPNGIPNPILIENRYSTQQAVIEHNADLGIAWDGDFDRCFFFDENGDFIEGYYIVGLLAESFLVKERGAKIIHDPRLTWNTIDIVRDNGGYPICCKTGHAFIKERMRKENAIYGGEMSAHHYFRDFAYCDSGMIPWLLVVELISIRGISMSKMVKERISAYPSSGEINLTLEDPKASINNVKRYYQPLAKFFDDTDGISFEFDIWRFNLRCSNTEPVVRLNVESRCDLNIVESKVAEILAILKH